MQSGNTGIDPYFMYGTAWKEEKTEELTIMALDNGFRAIDTANQRKHYFEEGVGRGIKKFLEGDKSHRKDIFIQSKFTYKAGQDHRLPYDPKAAYQTQVEQSFQSSLEHLNIDYLDSYILHGPSARMGLQKQDLEVWESMEHHYDEDLTKNIGVSNISAEQLMMLLSHASVKPKFVQNRCFARLGWDYHVRKICNENKIIYQGFSLLTANRDYLNHRIITEIANKKNALIPSVIFSFSRHIGMLPLTGTSSQKHMQQDLKGIDLELTHEEISKIERIATDQT